MARRASEVVSSWFRWMPITILGVELVGLLAQLFQKSARLPGEIDALDPAIDRVRLPNDEAGGLQPVDQRT